jgi:hypothetical protein
VYAAPWRHLNIIELESWVTNRLAGICKAGDVADEHEQHGDRAEGSGQVQAGTSISYLIPRPL